MVMNTRRRIEPQGSLPNEIWQVIAQHMQPKEWAKVAGVCKTTWQLQLILVHLKQYDLLNENLLCDKGAAWVLRRAQQAQQLLLDLPRGAAGQQATLEALMQVPGGFSRLTSLSIRLHAEEDSDCLIMATSWLLGQAKGLIYLRLGVAGLPYLPYLPHIRHLLLDASGDNFSRLAPALGALLSLQTLCLDGTKSLESPQADLDLLALTQLESMMLDGAVPGSLSLPSCTALHVVAYSLADAAKDIWPSAGGALKSFTLTTDELIKTEEDIPEWLLQPISLDTLIIAARCFGETFDRDTFRQSPISLKGALLCAARLCLDCKEQLSVFVPKDHKWSLVNFHSDDVLCVSLLDVAGLASSCQHFSIRYDHLEGTDLISLANYLTKHNLEFSFWQYGDVECSFSRPSRAEDLHREDASSCMCGACRFCCRLDNFEGKRVPSEEAYFDAID